MTKTKFDIIDKETGRKISKEQIKEILDNNNLPENDSYQFFIGQNEEIILTDGKNIGYCENDRFLPVSNSKYPDTNYCELQLIGNILHTHPEFKNHIAMHQIQAEIFPQLWASTAGGFEEPGMVAGAAMTTEYTTVLHLTLYIGKDMKAFDFYGVFFGNKGAYVVDNPPKIFFEDLKNKNMKSRYEAKKAY